MHTFALYYRDYMGGRLFTIPEPFHALPKGCPFEDVEIVRVLGLGGARLGH